MIPARPSRFFRWYLPRHAEGLLRRSFEGVHVEAEDTFVQATRERPVLLVANHSAWWDTILVLFLLPRRYRVDGFAMMDEVNLRRFPFFARVGAFGVDLRGGRAGPALDYAASLLSRPGRVVLVFPQGAERASTVRPLGFRRGAAVIAHRVPEAAVVPLGIRYEMGGTQWPLALLSFGAPVPLQPTVDLAREAQELAVTERLERLDETVIRLRDRDTSALAPFTTVCGRGAPWLGRLATRLLGLLARAGRSA